MSAWCAAAAVACVLAVDESGAVEAEQRKCGVEVVAEAAELVAAVEEATAGRWVRLGKLGVLAGVETCKRSTRSHLATKSIK